MKSNLFFFLTAFIFFSILGYIFHDVGILHYVNNFDRLVGPWNIMSGCIFIAGFLPYIFSITCGLNGTIYSTRKRTFVQTFIDVILIAVISTIFLLFSRDRTASVSTSVLSASFMYFLIYPNIYIYCDWCRTFMGSRTNKNTEKNFLWAIVIIIYIAFIIDILLSLYR